MTWRWPSAMLVVVAVGCLTGCAYDSDAYPNDQAWVVETLADDDIDVRILSASEQWGGPGQKSETYVTLEYDTATARASELKRIREVVWERYPHNVQVLSVESSEQLFEYTYDELEAELGQPEYRDEDSEHGPTFTLGWFWSSLSAGSRARGCSCGPGW